MKILLTEAVNQVSVILPDHDPSTLITAATKPNVELTVVNGASLAYFTVLSKPKAEVDVVGIPGPPSDQITVSDTPPSFPAINDLWVDTN